MTIHRYITIFDISIQPKCIDTVSLPNVSRYIDILLHLYYTHSSTFQSPNIAAKYTNDQICFHNYNYVLTTSLTLSNSVN